MDVDARRGGGLRPRRRVCYETGVAALAPLTLLETDLLRRFSPVTWASGFWCYTAALGLLAITTVRRLARLAQPL